jgi:hypothetical protein
MHVCVCPLTTQKKLFAVLQGNIETKNNPPVWMCGRKRYDLLIYSSNMRNRSFLNAKEKHGNARVQREARRKFMFWNWDLLVQACSTQMKVLDR